MKTLELNQMEKLIGGQEGDCTSKVLLLGLGLTTLALAGIASGGLITYGVFAGMVANGSSFAYLVSSGDCF